MGLRSYSTLSPVSTGMGGPLWASIPPWYVTVPTRSTQPCIPLGLLNLVLALIGWVKGGNVTSARWKVTLCDHIWHVSSHSGEAVCKLLYTSYLIFTFTWVRQCQKKHSPTHTSPNHYPSKQFNPSIRSTLHWVSFPFVNW